MVPGFLYYNIDTMTDIGKMLKKERESQKITLDDIEKTTKIRKKNLEYIEKDDWDKFSSKTYIVGIIKQYAKVLSLDEEKVIAFFRREYERKEDVHFKSKITEKYLTPQTKKIFRIGLVIIFLLFAGYFSYQLNLLFTPPKLQITSPTKTEFYNVDRIPLKGKTDKDTTINVNGERIYLKEDNTFETYIPLFNELNPVRIEAIGANGKKTFVEKIYIKK